MGLGLVQYKSFSSTLKGKGLQVGVVEPVVSFTASHSLLSAINTERTTA